VLLLALSVLLGGCGEERQQQELGTMVVQGGVSLLSHGPGAGVAFS